MCHVIVSQMKTTTIRELRHDTSTVLSWVSGGETVEVRRRGKPVAVLSSCRRERRVVRPDYVGRLKAIYGDGILPTTGTDIVGDSRGES